VVVSRSGAEALLERARARIARWTPLEAFRLVIDGALLVDIRPEIQRRQHGEVRYGVVIDRNVFEWRLDPGSPWRIPDATGPERTVVVLCQEGYASSLAAAALVELGYSRAGDVIGGFEAWRATGLPVQQAGSIPRAAPVERAV
jgi:rhodanese-related sulfurtransferase